MSNAITPTAEIRQSLTRMTPEFKLALPPQIDPDKFVRVAMTAVQQQPSLLEADRTSLYGSCMKAAQDGLVLDGREAALVVFRGKEGPKVQYMPMLAGLLKKIRQSGELKTIAAHVVRTKDKFNYYVDDTGEHFKHEPELDGDAGDVRLVYAVAVTKDGGVYFDRMSRADVEKVRAVSRAKDSGPWVQWWDEMAKKTVLRRLSKRLPMSTDIPEEDDEIRPQFTQPAAPPAPPVEKEVEAQVQEPTDKKRNSRLQAVVEAAAVEDAQPAQTLSGGDVI